MVEKWCPIKDFPNYEVSNLGQVRNSKTLKIMSTWLSNSKYKMLTLRNESGKHKKYIHRLVADAFYNGDHSNMVINHIDGDKLNNIVDNLEWCTPKQNTRHAIHTGLFTPYKLPPHKKEGVRVKIIETGEVFDSLTECANHINGFKAAISACLLGKVKTHMGYHFEKVQ